MPCSDVPIQTILGSECIGDSLPKIMGNFNVLAEATCTLIARADAGHGNHTGDVTSNGLVTTYGNVVPSTKGGAGTVSGMLKADGSGVVSAAVAGVDYITSALQSTSFTGTNQLLAQNGYQKLPGGLIIQWGRQSITTSGVAIPVSFSIPFPSAAYVVNGSGSNVSLNSIGISSISTSGFNVTITTGSTTLYWVAIGS